MCQHAKYSHGHRIGYDPGMPDFMHGSYLPGDEPGWYCDIDGRACEEDDYPHMGCPLEEFGGEDDE